MNRVMSVVALSAMLILAGCIGAGPGAEAGDGDGGSAADEGASSSGGSSGGGGSSGSGSSDSGDSSDGASGSDGSGAADDPGESGGEFAYFDFSRPARYEFEIYTQEDGEGTLVWDVQSVDGEVATVAVDYQMGDVAYQSTVTGSKEDIQGQLMMTPAGGFMFLGMFSPYYGYYEGQELRVGNQWSVSSADGSVSFDVTGTDNYAGVDCYVTQMQVNGNVVHNGCLSTDTGLAPFTAYYDEDGTETLRMELVGYERR